jgi:glycosyltransferase involved in cell wall biosynthesis
MPLHGLLMYAGCIGTVRRLHRLDRFDCIDAHYVYPDGLAAVLLGKFLGIPIVVSARGSDIHTFPQFRTIRPQIRWTLRHASAAIAVSDSLRQVMTELAPALDTIEVIGNGVDALRFFPQEQQTARKKLGLELRKPIILSVAALRHVKGPDLLVRAAALVKKRLPEFTVLFIGEGSELATLQQLAASLGCADVCRFLGRVPNENLRTYYAAADVSSLTSRNEGCPNVVLESLACGTPVVATRVGAVPGLLTPDSGIVVETTPQSISEGLLRALEQRWDRQAISARGREHTWESVADRVNDVLSRVLPWPVPLGHHSLVSQA